MLRIAVATLRTRWASFAGAFLALALGTGAIAMMALALTATWSTPFPGPQRYAAAPAVVVPPTTIRLAARSGAPIDFPVHRRSSLPADVVANLATTGNTVADRTFPARLPGGPPDQVGHAWSAAAFTPYQLLAGRAPAADNEVVAGGGDRSSIGRQVSVTTDNGRDSYTITGVTRPVWFEHALFFTDAAAARISPDVDAVVAYAHLDAVQRATQGSVARVLTGQDRHLADPDPSGGKDQLLDVHAMASISTFVVVAVAVFVVIATFAFVTDLRSREMALLRTVGATPGQVRRVILTEAGCLGVVAAATGCLLGVLGASSLNTWMIDNGVAPAWFTIDITVAPLIRAFVAGLVAAIIGAAAVSVRAGRVRPAEALRESAGQRRVMTVTRLLLGLGLLTAGGFGARLIAGSPVDALDMQHFVLVPVLLIGGFALLTPLVVKPVVHATTWPLRRLGAGSVIVRQNAVTGGRRTVAVVTPVVIAVGLAASVLTAQATAEQTDNAARRQQTRADFVVWPTGTTEISRPALTAIRAVPGVDIAAWTPALLRLGTDSGRYLGSLSAWAVDPAALTTTQRLPLATGSMPDVNSASSDDFMIIDQNTARDFGLRPADHVRAWLPDGTAASLRVTAETKTTASGETGYLSAAHAAGGLPTRVDVKVRPGTDPTSVSAALRAAAAGYPVKVSPSDSYLDSVRSSQYKEDRQAITVLLGIALAYSLVAVVSTMVIAASGRKREIASLSLAGSTRRQSLWFIAAEAIVAVLAGVIVAGAGATTVVIGQRAALTRLSADVPVSIPLVAIGEVIGVCLAVAVLTSMLSGWRVLRGRVVELAGLRE